MNITAFMNLMVILVPFLLITAVFSRLAVLELTLPGDAPQEQTDDTPAPPNVIVRADSLTLLHAKTPAGDATGTSGTRLEFPNIDGEYDTASLVAELVALKEAAPRETAITLRFEDDAPYDTMIQIMDAVRQTVSAEIGSQMVRTPLFPSISLGDAPPPRAAEATANPAAGTPAPQGGA